jgi:hypothetical protein
LPLTFLLFLAWSLACGEYRLLPFAVLVASFATQSHLIYGVPAVGALLVGIAGLLVTRLSVRGGLTSDRSFLRWVAAGLAVGLICWSAPLVDQIVNRPGNLQLLIRAAQADEPTLGIGVGRRALVRAVGIPPWWLGGSRSSVERVSDLSSRPSTLAVASTLLTLGGLAAVSLIGWRRRRGDVLAAAALALMLCAALVITASSIPRTSVITVGYALWWAAPAGMFVWMALIWSVVVLRPASTLRARRLPFEPAAAAGLALAAAAGIVVALSAEPRDRPFDQLREVTDHIGAALRDSESARVDATFGEGGFFIGRAFQFGTIYALRRQGLSVTSPDIEVLIGSQYGDDGGDVVVHIDAAGDKKARGRPVARVEVPPDTPSSKASNVTVTATIAPVR